MKTLLTGLALAVITASAQAETVVPTDPCGCVSDTSITMNLDDWLEQIAAACTGATKTDLSGTDRGTSTSQPVVNVNNSVQIGQVGAVTNVEQVSNGACKKSD